MGKPQLCSQLHHVSAFVFPISILLYCFEVRKWLKREFNVIVMPLSITLMSFILVCCNNLEKNGNWSLEGRCKSYLNVSSPPVLNGNWEDYETLFPMFWLSALSSYSVSVQLHLRCIYECFSKWLFNFEEKEHIPKRSVSIIRPIWRYISLFLLRLTFFTIRA